MQKDLEQLKVRVYDLIMERERVVKESEDSINMINNEIMITQNAINNLTQEEDGHISEESKL